MLNSPAFNENAANTIARAKARNTSLKTIPGSSITTPVLRTLALARVSQWNKRALNPKPSQLKILLSHCKTAASTEFGKKHQLGSVTSYEDYKARVPLRVYGDFEQDLQRMRKGARDVLWPGLIPYYGQSSGSSNTAALNKFLPISLEQIGWQKKAAFDLVARYLHLSKDSTFTSGFAMGLLPPSILTEESPGVMAGSNPGIMLRFVPEFAKRIAIPRPPIRDIPDYNQKLAAMADAYLDYDVRSLSGTTCWFPLMFDHVLAAARARGRNVSTISEIWPNLNALFGGGVYAAPYRKLIREKMGKSPLLIDNYNATEGGVFAASDRLDETGNTADGMLMIPDRGVFFEFVPRAEHGSTSDQANSKRISLWQVEPGVDYSVVLTTSSGLFAYYIGDFVRFTSIFPHRIEFAGRPSGMLSLTQELTSFIEIEKAFAEALEKVPCTIVDYTASSEIGVDSSGKGRYVFFVEFESEPKNKSEFLAAVDAGLCRQNRVYREHRANDVAILSPRLVTLQSGITKKFMKALGYHSVQNKFPRIINEERRDLLSSLNQNEQSERETRGKNEQ